MRAVGTWLPLAVVLTVATIAFLPFTWTGFAGTDSLTLIETSRVRSWSDLLALSARPVMDQTTFAQGELVYRPFVSLSFAADFALWGINPVGYHVTNLALHLATTVSVWALLRALGLSQPASLVGSALFALHPAAVASVPVIARRDSLVPVAAFTASMALLVRYIRQPKVHGWPWIVASVVLFAVALFSKESAFAAFLLVPVLIFAANALPQRDLGRHPLSIRECMSLLTPYAAVVVIALTVRLAVLGTLGGYQGVPIATVDPGAYRSVLAGYSRFLFWPFGELFPTGNSAWVLVLVAILAGLLVLATTLPRRLGVVLAVGCVWVAVFALFHALLKTFSGAWLVYFPLVGMSLIGGAVVDAVVDVVARRTAPPARPRCTGLRAAAASRSALGRLAATVALAVALGVWAVAVVRTSPLFVRYDDWNVAGSITARYVTAARDCMRDAPDGATLSLVNLPDALDAPGSATDLLAPTVLADHTVEAALRMAYPNRQFAVTATSSAIAPESAERLALACSGPPTARQLTATF
jgi:hypothetical protein